jgi:hypothetical protein
MRVLWIHSGGGLDALAHLGREWADRALVQKAGFFHAMCIRAVACGHLGRREEGREWVDRIREIAPDLTVESYREFLSTFIVPEGVAIQAEGYAQGWDAGTMNETRRLAAILATDV